MKKISILPLLTFLFSLSAVHAQITKGSLFLGGNISFNTSHMQSESNSAYYSQDFFAFSPVLGKAIKDNLIFGGNLTYSFSKYRQEQSGSSSIRFDQNSYGYGAGVFLRKYKSIGKGFYIFLEGGFGGRYDKTDSDPLYSSINNINNYKRTSFSLSANPGISYAISKKLHLEMGLNQLLSINYFNEKGNRNGIDGTKYETNSFNISSSLSNTNFSSIYFGFRVMIGK